MISSSTEVPRRSPNSFKQGIRGRLSGSIRQQSLRPVYQGNDLTPNDFCVEDQTEGNVDDFVTVPRMVGSEMTNYEDSLEFTDAAVSLNKPINRNKLIYYDSPRSPEEFGNGSGATATTAMASSHGPWGESSNFPNSLPNSPVAAAVPVVPEPHPHSAPAETNTATPTGGRNFLKGRMKLGGFTLPFDTTSDNNIAGNQSERFRFDKTWTNPQEDQTPETKGKAKLRKQFRKGIKGLKSFAPLMTGRKNALGLIPLGDEEENSHAGLKEDKVVEEVDSPRQTRRGLQRTFTDQISDGVKQTVESEGKVLWEKEEAKRRRREKQKQRLLKQQHDGTTNEDTDIKKAPRSTKQRSTHRQGRLDPEARERLKKHSAGNEYRNRNTTRERRRQLLESSKHLSARNQEGGRKRSLKEKDKTNDGEQNIKDEDQEQEVVAPKLARAVSAPQARKQKKEEDDKLRERIRTSIRQSSLHENTASALRDLLETKAGNVEEDDDGCATFAEDLGPDEPTVIPKNRKEEEHAYSTSKFVESFSSLQLDSSNQSNVKTPRISETSMPWESLQTSSTALSSSHRSSSVQGSSGCNISYHTVESQSNRSKDYLQLVIDSVPIKAPSPPVSPMPERKEHGGSKSMLKDHAKKSSRGLKKEGSSRKHFEMEGFSGSHLEGSSRGHRLRKEGSSRSHRGLDKEDSSRRRRRSAERPSTGSRQSSKRRGESEPRRSSRRNSSIAVQKDEAGGNASASILVMSDHKGQESCTVLDRAARSPATKEKGGNSDLLVSASQRSSSRYMAYTKYVAKGEVRPPTNLVAPFAGEQNGLGASEPASEVAPGAEELEVVKTSQEEERTLNGVKETDADSTPGPDDKEKTISKGRSSKHKESGDRAGQSKHRKRDEGASGGGLEKKSSRGRSKGLDGKRSESGTSEKRREHSLDAKLRKKSGKDGTKANHKKNSATQELGRSLANFNW